MDEGTDEARITDLFSVGSFDGLDTAFIKSVLYNDETLMEVFLDNKSIAPANLLTQYLPVQKVAKEVSYVYPGLLIVRPLFQESALLRKGIKPKKRQQVFYNLLPFGYPR